MERKHKRAARRKHKFRMRRRAQRANPDWDKAFQRGDHIKSCSCWMCGNRRKYEGLPVRERRAADLKDWLDP